MSGEVDEATRERSLSCDEAIAQRDALRGSLRSMVRLVHDVGGFLKPEHQVDLRHAEAVLVEVSG